MQNIPTKTDGVSTLPAMEFNQIPDEMENVITTAGISLSSGDLNQMAKAISHHAALDDYYTDSGTAGAYVLVPGASRLSPPALVAGLRVRFRPANANSSGACTVNVNSLGVKNIKMYTGSDPVANALVAGGDVQLVYDGTNFVVVSISSAASGAVTPTALSAATQAQMETATDTTTYVTPGRTQYHPGVVKAWASIYTDSGSTSLMASWNVASITTVTSTKVRVTFTTAMSSANYCVAAETQNVVVSPSSTTSNVAPYYAITTTYADVLIDSSATNSWTYLVFLGDQ